MASRGDVVVITINYRLGTLGFLALDDGITNGNYGLVDQITALDWIAQNIRNFGGDPDRITVFGQSAGASLIRALLASPMVTGKLSAAIMQSNLGGSLYAESYSKYYYVPAEVEAAANPILAATKCSGSSSPLHCLRHYDAFELTNLDTVARYIVVDGTYVTNNHLALDGSGPAAHVPVLTGTVFDDAVIFLPNPGADNLTRSLANAGFNASSIIRSSQFPLPDRGNPALAVYQTTMRVGTDAMFRCSNQATAAAASQHKVFPSLWYYEFNRTYSDYPDHPQCLPPATAAHPYGDPEAAYSKCHSGDLVYVFGNIVFQNLPIRDEYDIPFSQYVLDSWTSFARTHDPNPDLAYLEAREYTNTSEAVRKAGTWKPVQKGGGGLTKRLLQRESVDLPFGEVEQCRVLGLPLDYYA